MDYITCLKPYKMYVAEPAFYPVGSLCLDGTCVMSYILNYASSSRSNPNSIPAIVTIRRETVFELAPE